MIIDSHCHLDCIDLSQFNNDLGQVLLEAKNNGVEHILCVNIEMRHFERINSIAQSYDNISISVGVHPNTDDEPEVSLEQLIELASTPKCIAIGETGLDYYRSEGDLDWQRERFRTHIKAALSSKKPLIIHTRNAAKDTLQIMTEEQANSIGGVMHCFSEDWQVAKKALDLNFYISFSGIVTFKNAHILKEVARKTPLNRVLIETDSPYLAPVPYRGKQNHPALVKYVASYLSDLLAIDYEEFAAITTENFYRCFNVKTPPK
jgi:TatD DNase family protein